MLSGLDDFAGLYATRAYFNAANAAVYDRSHALKIRIKTPFSSVVCVADAIAELRPFIAKLTPHRHDEAPPDFNGFRSKN